VDEQQMTGGTETCILIDGTVEERQLLRLRLKRHIIQAK